ncbi:SDR family NAD(P)-dependent oxidoreductase [Chitinophaga sp. GCM10012297]|uniref:SDR family NAD(P)-dependent oxidoreductase n=1 Tax=Chitinophaga chungangae TaxID=2821488 RepID=A0ABS3YA27_9BACT|nr:SDR family NAD(P)-dependent oxidoreductase [Chitinophaga chungangae]MBO9151529.1 SDR family NAD(P)-dependent oxidoreductase [Chitinophaga chungangae]
MSKTILITGSGSGYGNLIAKALSEEGHGVIAGMQIIDEKSRKAADDLCSIPNIEVVAIDLDNERSISESVGRIIHKYGAIDILINDAEVASFGLLEATSIAQIRQVLDIGLLSVIRMIQAVLPDMRKNKAGVILNICCGPSLFSAPFLIPQTLAKMGIMALSEGLQAELKLEGIDCLAVLIDNCLSGSINNKLFEADLPEIAGAYKIESRQVIRKVERSIREPELALEKRQDVAKDIVDLLNMKSGLRPKQLIVDKKNERTIRELFVRKIELKNKWAERAGIKLSATT